MYHFLKVKQGLLIAGKRRTLVDSFLALKEANDEEGHTYQQSASAQSAQLSLKDGVFR